MKKSNLFRTTIPVIAFIFLLILTFSCQQQVEEGITDEEVQALVEKDMEIFNEGNLSMIDEIIAPNYKQHISDDPEFTPRNVQTEEDRRTTVYAVQLLVETPLGKLKPGMPADVVFALAE